MPCVERILQITTYVLYVQFVRIRWEVAQQPSRRPGFSPSRAWTSSSSLVDLSSDRKRSMRPWICVA